MKTDLPLLLRNATLFDGTGSPGRVGDLLICNGRIAPLGGADLQSCRVLDLDGCLVSPGWVDLHTHVFNGHGIFSLPPEEIGRITGVTTLVDAGSAGAANYPLFEEGTRRLTRERVVGYVNVATAGLLHGHAGEHGFIGDHFHTALHSLEMARAVYARFPDRIVGWKVRLSAALADHDRDRESSAFATLLKLKAETGLPVMIHHILSNLSIDEILPELSDGDVYTHCYHGCENSPFEDASGLPKPITQTARDRGVLFDVGHGSGAFRWTCAEKACCNGGFWPDVISTDLHRFNIFSPVRNLATVMSRFLHLGMPIEEVIASVTGRTTPALRNVGIAPTLREGDVADLTIFQLQHGAFDFGDCHGEIRRGETRIVPLAVLQRDQLTPCYGYHLRISDNDALATSWQSIV